MCNRVTVQVRASRAVGAGVCVGGQPRQQGRQELHAAHAERYERQHALHEGAWQASAFRQSRGLTVSWVQACLRAGSDMDAVNSDGNTAAHLAFKFGNNELGECVPFLPVPAQQPLHFNFRISQFLFVGICFPRAPATASRTRSGWCAVLLPGCSRSRESAAPAARRQNLNEIQTSAL
jgi:hypothetical protein